MAPAPKKLTAPPPTSPAPGAAPSLGAIHDPLSRHALRSPLQRRALADTLIQREGTTRTLERARERQERRRTSYKPGLNPKVMKQRREEQGQDIRKQRRAETTELRRLSGSTDDELDSLQTLRDQSPQEYHELVAEKRLDVERAIRELLSQAGDSRGLQDGLEVIQRHFQIEAIQLQGVEEGLPRIRFKINPEYEIPLTAISGIAMRAEGSGTGTLQTHAEWTTQSLSLGSSTFTVGHSMTASPLSQDHPTGSEAKADSEHDPLMKLMPTAGTHPGDKRKQYVKGHLLNDNIGGIANSKNLYPITGHANGQHLQFVESYIKSAIDQGYVMAYRVVINEKSKGTTPFNSTTLHTVDSDLEFEFFRLDINKKPVGSVHRNHIESRFDDSGTEPYVQKTEFKGEYTDGRASKPETLKKQASLKVKKRNSKVGSNKYIDIDKPKSFTLGTPDTSHFTLSTAPLTPTTTASINTSYVPPSQRLMLRASTQEPKLITQYGLLVTGWPASDIAVWLKALRALPKLNRWAVVEDEAVAKGKLDAKIAKTLFAVNGPGRSVATLGG